MYYFGCWSARNKGHHLYDKKGSIISHYTKVPELPELLQPKRLDNPPKTDQSKIILEIIGDFTVISMKDESADSRPGSHSKFIIQGHFDAEEMVKLFHQHFPEQAERIAKCKPFTF